MRTTNAEAPVRPEEVRRVHERLAADAGLRESFVHTADGAAVHVLESGTGPPLLLVHGSGSPGLFWLPLMERLAGRHLVVVDRPGFGLSDPGPPGPDLRSEAVTWLDRTLDALGLTSATVVGHSMGGLWGLWFALDRPRRVDALAMLGVPALPGTRVPLPFRVMGTPGLGTLVARQRETPATVRRFAAAVGEGESIGDHPDLVSLLVATGNDPLATRAVAHEVRALVSPWALVTKGFRPECRVTRSELESLGVPTLVVWGDHDPVGAQQVAEAVHAAVPGAELGLVTGGHAPWLGSPDAVGRAITQWLDHGVARG